MTNLILSFTCNSNNCKFCFSFLTASLLFHFYREYHYFLNWILFAFCVFVFYEAFINYTYLYLLSFPQSYTYSFHFFRQISFISKHEQRECKLEALQSVQLHSYLKRLESTHLITDKIALGFRASLILLYQLKSTFCSTYAVLYKVAL